MCTAVSSRNDLDALLHRFLAGDHFAREELPRVARPYLRKIARRLGTELPDDIQQEVVNQALLNLTQQKPGNYDPERGTAKTFLRFMLQNAVRQVRASYAPPGHVTRVRRSKGAKGPIANVRAAHISPLHELNDADMPAIDGGIPAAEARHDAHALLRQAPTHVAASLERLYLQEHVLNDVAVDLGISRYSLSRQIAQFAEDIRATYG